MNKTYKIDKAAVLCAGVFCLVFSCVLFVLGWVKPVFSIPFSLLLLVASSCCCRNITKEWNETYRYCVFSRSDALLLFLTLLILLVAIDLVGFLGHVPQATDMAVRNAIYAELQKSAWPIYSARGEYFIYYHAFWLPPALLSKFFSFNIGDTLLFGWIYITLSIGILALFIKIRGKVLIFTLLFLLTGNLIENLKFFPIILEKMGESIPFADAISQICSHLAVESHFRYLHTWGQLVYTFNHAVPLILYTSIILSGMVPARYILFLSALVFPVSPLGVAPLIPVLLFIIFKKNGIIHTFICWENWVGLLLTITMVVYMYGQHGGSSGMVMLWQDFQYWPRVSGTHGAFVNVHVRMLRYVTVASAIIFTVRFLIVPRLRNSVWYKAFVYLAIILPIIWIGRWNNEFLFKGSVVLYMLLAWILVTQWKHATNKRRLAIILVTILSSFHIVSDVSRRHLYRYTWETEAMQSNKRQEWGGTLNRPDIYSYSNFWGQNVLPGFFCDTPGKSIIK